MFLLLTNYRLNKDKDIKRFSKAPLFEPLMIGNQSKAPLKLTL